MRQLTIDQLAERLLMSRYLRALSFRLARPNGAEDLLQQTIVDVVIAAQRDQLKADRALLTFATTVMKRRAMESWSEMPCEPLPTYSESGDEFEVADLRPSSMPDHRDEDRLAQVYRLVRYLKPLDQRVFRLSFIDGLNREQTAARLGLTYDQVRNLRHRVLGRLRLMIANGDCPLSADVVEMPIARTFAKAA